MPDAVVISDSSTGKAVRTLMSDPWQGMQVDSTSVDRSGQIWVTLTSGPSCTSNIAGCGPLSGSCSGQVVKINPAVGTPSVVLKAPADDLIGDAQPSPDGTMLAYLDGVCNRSYFNQHLEVRDLATGRSWSIGAALPACHSLGSLSWTPDGHDLVANYGASPLAPVPAEGYGDGVCVPSDPNQIAVIPALEPADGLPGTTIPVDPRCQAEAVTATASGYAAIEACGQAPYFLSGPAFLITIGPADRIASRTPLGSCVNGADLRAAAGSDLLGSSYQFCNPPGTVPPRRVTFTFSRGHLNTIINSPDYIAKISW